MKKIYLSLATIALCLSATAQTAPKTPVSNNQRGYLAPESKIPAKVSNALSKVQNGPFKLQLDPIEQIMTQKGIDLTSGSPQEDTFLATVFQDSTVSIATSTGAIRVNGDILLGTTFDPTSIFLQNTFEPIASKYDSYNVDSVFIQASYVKKTTDTDTLYVWLVWGDSTNTNVYTKSASSAVWVSPISTWRKSVLCPRVTGAVAADGNKIRAAAPATNQKLVKYVLQPEDSTARGYGFSKFISIPFTTTLTPSGVTIPAGNVVSCFYTFVPQGTHALNQPMYSFTTSVVPTINGFAGIIWSQSSPVVNSVTDYQNYQVDNTSWNMGISYDKGQRYAKYNAFFNGNALGDLTTSPRIFYSITGNSTVGVNELDKKGFVLGQNTPNPFNGESKVSYMLSKDAKSAVFTVTDVMGRVISTENVANTTGTHIVKLGSYPAGIYYYSLNVDGNVTTNKMIAQ